MIEPNVDWYGSYARRSALADYLELAALAGKSFSAEQLADLVRDNDWAVALGERIGTPTALEDEAPESLGEEIDLSLDRAQDVLVAIDERLNAIDDRYPFSADESGRIAYVGEGVPNEDPYVRLLCVTVAHATAMALTPRPYQVFEDMVAAALSNAGLLTTGVGARARAGGGFHAVLTESCAAVGLMVYPDRARARKFANDEGSDVLTNMWPLDRRAGGLQLIGQATCARSNDWEKKMGEPSPTQWRRWLGSELMACTYLAVPHHVEDVTRTWLMEKRERDVFDRLRLAPILGPAVNGEAAAVTAVLEAGVAIAPPGL